MMDEICKSNIPKKWNNFAKNDDFLGHQVKFRRNFGNSQMHWIDTIFYTLENKVWIRCSLKIGTENIYFIGINIHDFANGKKTLDYIE